MSKYLILLILVFGCKSIEQIDKREIIGTYESKGIYGVVSNITLNENQTFSYNWQIGLMWGTTNGNWALIGNNLILNSDEQPIKEEGFVIRERNKTDKKQFEIKIIDEKEKNELIAASCYLMKNGTIIEEKSTDKEGNCILIFNENADILKVDYIGYNRVEIPIDKLKSNSFILELKENTGHYKYFTNRKWKVKKGGIYDSEIKKSRYIKQ